jgi:hypothetical protein
VRPSNCVALAAFAGTLRGITNAIIEERLGDVLARRMARRIAATVRLRRPAYDGSRACQGLGLTPFY